MITKTIHDHRVECRGHHPTRRREGDWTMAFSAIDDYIIFFRMKAGISKSASGCVGAGAGRLGDGIGFGLCCIGFGDGIGLGIGAGAGGVF